MIKMLLFFRQARCVCFVMLALMIPAISNAETYLGMPVLDVVNGYKIVDVRPLLATISYQNGSAETAWKHVSASSELVPMHVVSGYPRWEYDHGELAFRWFPEQFPYVAIYTMGIYYENGRWVATKTGATRHNAARIIDFGDTYGGGGSYPEAGWNLPWNKNLPTVSVCFPVEGTHISVGVVVNDKDPIPEPTPPNNTYQLVEADLSWHSAVNDAESKGGYLATITSSAEWDDIISQLGSTLAGKDAWFGATDEGDEGKWRWITGEPWAWAKWGIGQPNNASDDQHYGHIDCTASDNSTWTWDDISDVNRSCYILEIGSVPNPTPTPAPTPTPVPTPTPAPTPTPTPGDSDGDGINDQDEPQYGTDPHKADTDDDGLDDGVEVWVYQTNPTLRDTDNDGLSDSEELARNMFILVNSTPGLTWAQAREDALNRYGHLATFTSTWELETKRDTLEVLLQNSSGCWLGASDQDTENVWQWITGETWFYTHWKAGQPNNYNDQDCLCFSLDPADPLSWDDNNSHAVLNSYLLEMEYNTSPLKSDTDDDTLPDGWEVYYNLNPLSNDANDDLDKDGLTNKEEYHLLTNPANPDTDGDGFTDLQERDYKTNPNDPASHPPYAFPYPGDYDGDGWADKTSYKPAEGKWYMDYSSSPDTLIRSWGWDASTPAPGDYDGDGQMDIAVYYPQDGNWYIQAGEGLRIVNWGWSKTIPLPGDYDGDGQTDLAVFYPATGDWYVHLSKTGTARIQRWGWEGVTPVPADYDGDGITDFAVYTPENGTWFILESKYTNARMESWGWSEAIPVPADYDGDHKADITVFHPATGNWYIQSSITGNQYVRNWGWSATLPAPADYNGDGKDDIAVFWPAQSIWYIQTD